MVLQPGPSCSLTMSLVNDSLKFQMAILQIVDKMCEYHFINRNNKFVFAYVVGIYLI